MAGDEIIRIKSVNDGKGANDAQKDLKEVGDEAERTAARTAAANARAENSFAHIQKGIAGVRRAMGTLNAILSGFGLIGVITTMVTWFKSLYEWIGKSAKEAQRLREEAKFESVVKGVQEAEAAQRAFNEQIRQSLRLMDEQNAKADAQTTRRRSVEDAKLKLEEANALAGVEDPNERQRIQNDFARRRAEIQMSRAQEDETAAAARANDKVITQEVNVHKAENQEISVRSQIKTLDQDIAAEGDPEKKAKLEDQRKKLESTLKEAEAEVARQKELLHRAQEAQEAIAGMSEASVISSQADLQNIANSEADRKRSEAMRKAEEKRKADEAAAKEAAKAAQAAADKDTVASGKSELEGLQLNADAARTRAQAAADAYAKEQGDVFTAQNRYDMLVQNGGSKKEKSAALAALQKEKAEALEALHEMEKVTAEVANVLQGINAQIKTLSNAVQKAESRLAQNQTDAPEG